MKPQERDALAVKAIERAKAWQERANQLMTHEEKGITDQMLRLLTHPRDKVILTQLIDQSFRSENPRRVADQVNSLLREYGVPDFFSSVDKLLVQMFLGLGRYIPSISVPKMIDKMRHDSSRAIIPGEPEVLQAHLKKRKRQGVRMNINHLGEAILGEEEAQTRLKTYIEDLKNPEVEYISVKISTIYSQIEPLAFEHTLAILHRRLARLYQTAMENFFVRHDGTQVPKFVNLDMEEYRDLEITCEAFTRTLDGRAFKNHAAGIVLQAYLPDAFAIQKQLTQWAQKRVAAGGSPIKIRIVKGANMEMEHLEAALYNWPLAPYDNKRDVDANYKRMVAFGMQPQNIQAVNLGIASHNLFELAYAYELGRLNRVTGYFNFEMLEGMADHVRRALFETTGEMLLYAPVATRDQFINAIAYLVRRLDENTAPENFLRYLPKLRTDSEEWAFLKEQFVASIGHMDRVGDRPHRIQDRRQETFATTAGTFQGNAFKNEPDTDWSLKANRQWAETIRDKWQKRSTDLPLEIPLVVAGKDLFEGQEQRPCKDASQGAATVQVARFALAGEADIQAAVATAKADPDGWRHRDCRERHQILSEVAMALRRARGDLIGAAAANTGKVFSEADVEVSEAIDFAEFYPFSVGPYDSGTTLASQGKGVGLVIAPWNFPIAIPCGGIVAALAAGNTVIFKPSSDAVLVAWVLCRCFWEAGISQKVLQFVPCSGAQEGAKLTGHPDIDFIILTGGTDTGMAILKQRPDVLLAAETGGKNATIVTAMSDRGQAAKNVVSSAFGHCGQKCSATSLLILEQEVYEDATFKRQLVDAAQSLGVGSAWDFENRMGPLIQPPRGALKKALTELEPGETWALKPVNKAENPYLWTPGIKWDVQPGSTTHMTEFFGPLLGVMSAQNLEEAIDLVHQTGYGLTAGLESLDKREQAYFKAHMRAGNLYVNRGTTGAITLRQPFGGMGKSALGAGIKAGGPRYVTQFMDFVETGLPQVGVLQAPHSLLHLVQEWENNLYWGQLSEYAGDLNKTIRAVKSCLYHWERDFSQEQDYFNLRGQDNLLRYLPVGKVVIRVHPHDALGDLLTRTAAARITGCQVVVSLPEGLDSQVVTFLRSKEGRRLLDTTPLTVDTDEDLIKMLPQIDRIRYAAPDRVPGPIWSAAASNGFYIARAPVLMHGAIELLHYLKEQSICDSYHRYGNLGERGL